VRTKRNGLVVICGLTAALSLGCQNEEIRSYRVPKPEATRLLAVIIPHGEKTWFFKLVGPAPQVEEHKQAFDQFIRSVRFTDQGERAITWTVPDSWLAGPASNLRYAAFYLGPKDHPLELTVFEFSGATGSVLANVNRWRNEMRLRNIQESELSQISKELRLENGLATMVDMATSAGGSAARMPAPDIVSRRSGPQSAFHYDKPQGWKEKPDPKRIRLVLFEIGEGLAEAGVSVLPRDGGGLLTNVNRWRGQIHLEQTDEEQLRKEMRPIGVGGTAGQYIDLVGPESAGQPRQRILGVVVPRTEETWFFKLQGPADVVEKEKTAFETFVKSVRFNAGTGANP